MALLNAAIVIAASTSVTPSTVYIIRHGEKIGSNGCLSKTGEARAASLPAVFDGQPSPSHPTFSVPFALFAHAYDSSIDCERCRQTLTPISNWLHLPINSRFGSKAKLGGNEAAAVAIVNTTGVERVVLVAWEHENIRSLTSHLGVDKSLIPYWNGDDYDTVFELQMKGGAVVNFTVTKQGFQGSVLQ